MPVERIEMVRKQELADALRQLAEARADNLRLLRTLRLVRVDISSAVRRLADNPGFGQLMLTDLVKRVGNALTELEGQR